MSACCVCSPLVGNGNYHTATRKCSLSRRSRRAVSENLYTSFGTKWTFRIQTTVFLITVLTNVSASSAYSTLWPTNPNLNSTSAVPVIAQTLQDHEAIYSTALHSSPRLLFANHPDGSQSIIGTWFSFTSFTVMMAFFGTSYMLALAATAVYYVLFAVTEPTQHGSVFGRAMNTSPASASASILQSSSNSWTYAHVLQLIYLAYDTYSTLDLQNIECQEKILCEFQRTDNDSPGPSALSRNDPAAETLENSKNEVVRNFMRKVSNFLFYLDIFKSIPNMKEYQEAIRVGQYDGDRGETDTGNRTQSTNISICDEIYSDCKFSVRKFNTYYKKLFGQ